MNLLWWRHCYNSRWCVYSIVVSVWILSRNINIHLLIKYLCSTLIWSISNGSRFNIIIMLSIRCVITHVPILSSGTTRSTNIITTCCISLCLFTRHSIINIHSFLLIINIKIRWVYCSFFYSRICCIIRINNIALRYRWCSFAINSHIICSFLFSWWS